MSVPAGTGTDAEAIVYLPVDSADPEAEAVLKLRPTEDGQTVMLAGSVTGSATSATRSAASSKTMISAPLPPRPDPYTGEPRPPAAPLEPLAGTGQQRPERGEERYLGDAPPGMGPTLEGHKFSTKNAFKAGVFLAVVGLVFASLYSWVGYGDSPFSWAGVWYVWLVIVVLCFGIPLVFMRGTTVICGADWLKQNGAWVELYELSQVKVRTYGVRFFLDMADHAGRTLSCDLVLLQRKPSIWDYVYNGIVHSVASGKASVNKIAVGKLQLPLPAEFIDD